METVSRIGGIKEPCRIERKDIQLLAVGRVEQIADTLVVDLHERHEARVVDVILRLATSDLFKEIGERSRQQSQQFGIADQRTIRSRRSQYSVRLP